MKKVLIIAPKVPDYPENRRDARIYSVLSSLAREYEVHLMYIQSMFTKEESVKKLESLGIKVVSFQEARQKVSRSLEKQLEAIFKPGEYAIIMFNTYFTAKYYLPYVRACAPGSVIVIDAGKSQYISELIFACECTDYFKKTNLLKNVEVDRMKEIPIYNYADAVIVDSEECRARLAADIPTVDVRVIPETARTAAKDGETGRDILDIFTSLGKAEKGGGTTPIDTVIVASGESPQATLGDEYLRKINHVVLSGNVAVKRVGLPAGSTPVERYNSGLKAVTSEYGLITDDNTIVPENSLNSLLFCARSHPEYGIIVPQTNHTLGYLVKPENIPDFLPKHYVANFGNWHDVKKVGGSCMLVKKELLEAVGLLDTSFLTLTYAFYDFCHKAFQRNYKTILANEAFVYHNSAPSPDREALNKDRMFLYNKWCDEGTQFLEDLK